ncbi:phosphoesterase [Pseudoponticoccus marisrubri]|uniref:Phosphoesterase n=1 Tax=Pseudoponticoccus marisrubri TaxID=1685382 RepID=A0A0W7WLA6_9RHOB|nr:phosphoesterase [Pseudoponticoccus marisrubri]
MGHWDGSADRSPVQAGRDSWTAFRSMGARPRRIVTDRALGDLFAVDLGDTGLANAEGHVTCRARRIVTLTRPDDALLAEHQLHYLRSYADLRPDRLGEINSQIGDLQSFYAMVGYMSPEATPWTIALNLAVLRLCAAIEMPLKHGFDVPRPIAMSYKVQPVIQTPGHGAWPSGHATEAFATATLLTRLFYNRGFDPVAEIHGENELYRHAARIAMNRTVAGVHFPTDSMAGAVLGITLAEALVRLLDAEPTTPARRFRGDSYQGDFNLFLLSSALGDDAVIETTSAPCDGPALPAWLRRMWSEAQGEW